MCLIVDFPQKQRRGYKLFICEEILRIILEDIGKMRHGQKKSAKIVLMNGLQLRITGTQFFQNSWRNHTELVSESSYKITEGLGYLHTGVLLSLVDF
jgi:hypothetical protein